MSHGNLVFVNRYKIIFIFAIVDSLNVLYVSK